MKNNNKQTFINLEEVFNIIGKKTFGESWSWRINFEPQNRKGNCGWHTVAKIVNVLIEESFFDVYVDGYLNTSHEEIYLFENYGNSVSSKIKIPEEQFKYVVNKKSRYCDSLESKYPKIILYRAVFESNSILVKKSFNAYDVTEIKEQINIQGFDYYLKQDNLKEDYIYLVMLGINPEYYSSLSDEEKSYLSAKNIFPVFKDSQEQNMEIINFVRKIKECNSIKWQNNWQDFIKKLYENGFFISDEFSDNCTNFINHIKNKGLIPNNFDHYLDNNFELFKANYDEYIKKESELSQEDVGYLAMGLNPAYIKRYIECSRIISDDDNSSYSALGDADNIFFYKSYSRFLANLRLHLMSINYFRGLIYDISYEGNFIDFINKLYNEGFILSNHLNKYLREQQISLKLSKDSWVYKYLKYLCYDKQFWSLEEAFEILVQGKIVHSEEL